MSYRFKPGDIVVSMAAYSQLGYHALRREGAHRTYVDDIVHPSEAYWEGPCYWMRGLYGPRQMPEAYLLTEDEFETACRQHGVDPVYTSDYVTDHENFLKSDVYKELCSQEAV